MLIALLKHGALLSTDAAGKLAVPRCTHQVLEDRAVLHLDCQSLRPPRRGFS